MASLATGSRAFSAALALGMAGCDRSPPSAASQPAADAPTAPTAPSHASAEPSFDMQRAMLPMRDGVSLETVIFTPRPLPKPLPMLFTRTPYGIPSDDRSVRSEWFAPLRANGY